MDKQEVMKRLANMNIDERKDFLRSLKSNSRSVGETAVAELPEEKIIDGDNFYMSLPKRGNLASMARVKKEIPIPAGKQVQIKVKAASLNFRDLMMALGLYPATPGMVSVMGSDFAGIVTEIGDEVTEFKLGDEVIFLSGGSLTQDGELDPESHFAAYSCAHERQIVMRPKNISWEEAACIPSVYLTSYYSLMTLARLTEGESVLIHTASGGVGQSAIQIAKWMKANIFVTAGTDDKREYLKNEGFDPMDSRSIDFIDEIKRRTDGKGVDIILNTLAGEASERGPEILTEMGRFIQIDKKDIAKNASIPIGEFKKGLTYSAVDLGLFYHNPKLLRATLNSVVERYTQGDFEPLTCEKYSIENVGDALTSFARANHIGKFTLTY
ncbi:MAG: NADPH:quinone reductase-like Zn-dependent oxidoreductase [Crocinitomicaceae bacterium]|jgi:NADPH:quinone reductase-like Zn-dependent oxidoreductase